MSKILRLSIPFILACLFLGMMIVLARASSQAVAAPSRSTPEGAILVNTLKDELNTDGDCSLREAIEAANTNTSVDACGTGEVVNDIITFDVAGTITVTSQLSVAAGGPLVISGGGAIKVSGGNIVRTLYINAEANLTLEGLTLVDGNQFMGGGIYNLGTLMVSDSIISGNHADYSGGGLYNDFGEVTVSESTIISNSASDGGGINNFGTMNIISSTISGNTAQFGGGIQNSSHEMTITNSIIRNNSAGNEGGGIRNQSQLTIISSTLSGNSAFSDGGGINNEMGLAKIINSILSGNRCIGDFGRGGGINNNWILFIINSTFSDNTALGRFGLGGGIDSIDTVIISNSTFMGNRSILGGSTINTGEMYGDVTVSNSIIAGSLFGINCSGTISDGGYNIEDSNTCGFDPANSSRSNTNPLLLPLRDNGSPTLTHSLYWNSPAIDAGDDTQCPPTDQRGVSRPLDGDGDGLSVCDIGSYELEKRPYLQFLPLAARSP